MSGKRGNFKKNQRKPLDRLQHGEDVDSEEVDAMYQELASLANSPTAITPAGDGAMELSGWQLTSTGLIPPDALDEQEYRDFGRALMRLDTSMQWLLGDWINLGDNFQWGETYQQLAEEFDYKVATLHDYAYVCRKVQFSIRIENLSFGHHQVVASMDEDEQEKWLTQAADDGLSIAKLRKAIKQSKLPPPSERVEQGTVHVSIPDDRTQPIPSDDTRPRPPAPEYTNRNFAAGDRIYHNHHGLARIERVEDHAHVTIRTGDTNSRLRNIHESEIELAAEDTPQQQQPRTPLPRDERDTSAPTIYHCPHNIGDWLALEQKPGRVGKVVHIKNEQNPVIVTVRMHDNGEDVSALLGAWKRVAPPSAEPRGQRTPATPAAAINDLPPEVAGELRSTIQVLALMADQHEPTDGIEQVRDALEGLRSGTLEDMTSEQLTEDENLLKEFATYMRDVIHEALTNAINELKQRRNS